MKSTTRTAIGSTAKVLTAVIAITFGLLVVFGISPLLGWIVVLTFYGTAIVLGVYAVALWSAESNERRAEVERLIEESQARLNEWEER